jgi:hypothetical protein
LLSYGFAEKPGGTGAGLPPRHSRYSPSRSNRCAVMQALHSGVVIGAPVGGAVHMGGGSA